MVMLCKSITEAELLKGNWQNWYVQQKLDGSRVMLVKKQNQINLISRTNNDYTNKYPEIVDEAKDLPDCILDGELTFYDNNGKDIFLTSLATAETIKEYGVKPTLMLFDVIELEGINLCRTPLLSRKEALRSIFVNRKNNNIKLLSWHDDAVKLWEYVKEKDAEGIVIKHKQSSYTPTPNYRSKYWLKIKNWREAELIMDGFEYMSNADKGITLINKEGYRVACAGEQSKKVIAILEKEGKVKVKIQYLQKTNEGKFRFISYRGLA